MKLQLTYISSARPVLLSFDFEEILETSRRNNARNDITGLLIFDGKRFLQVLEGPTSLVEQTYEKIRDDTRHRALVQLSAREVSAREFGRWSMASHIVGPVMGKGDLIAQVDEMTDAIADPNMRATLRSFARFRGQAPV